MIYCAQEAYKGLVCEYGYVADSDAEARHIAFKHGWQFLGKLDDMVDVSDQDRAMIEKDCLDLTVH